MKQREESLSGKSGKKGESAEQRRAALEAVTGREAVAYAIVYNNALFLLASVAFSFYIFSSAGPT